MSSVALDRWAVAYFWFIHNKGTSSWPHSRQIVTSPIGSGIIMNPIIREEFEVVLR